VENLRLTPEKFDVDWKTLIQWLLRVFEGLFQRSFDPSRSGSKTKKETNETQ